MTEHSSSQRTDSKGDDGSSKTITKEELREILAECTGTGLPEDFDDATPLVLDSYVATWMRQLLEDKLGAVVVLTPDIAGALETVGALHAFVNQGRNSPDSPSSPGSPSFPENMSQDQP